VSDTIFNIHDVILLMTAFLCILFALLLLSIKSNKRVSNVFLALFLLQHAAIPLDVLISFGAEFREIALEFSPNLFYFFSFGYWLEAPLLLWYVRSIIYKNYNLRLTDLIYLLPFFANLLHQSIFFYSVGYSDRVVELASYEIGHTEHYIHWISLAREAFRVALGLLCLYELHLYRKHLRSNYYSIDKDELSWLSILVVGFTLLRVWAVVVLLMVVLDVVFGVTIGFGIAGLTGNYTAFLLVSLLIFFSLGHAHVHEGIDRDVTETKDLPPQYKTQLIEHMQTRKPYTNTILTLDRLAEQIGIPARTLSSVINRQFSCNFYEFINSYRVEETKQLLNKHPDKTILEIMHEAGFNSKATFNTFFKKTVGKTPTEYRRTIAKSD